MICETDADKRAQHHKVTLCEIHRFGGFVNQHEPQSDQSVDTAIGKPTDDELKKIHGAPPKDQLEQVTQSI